MMRIEALIFVTLVSSPAAAIECGAIDDLLADAGNGWKSIRKEASPIYDVAGTRGWTATVEGYDKCDIVEDRQRFSIACRAGYPSFDEAEAKFKRDSNNLSSCLKTRQWDYMSDGTSMVRYAKGRAAIGIDFNLSQSQIVLTISEKKN